MTPYVGAAEAARLLGVQRSTLYAYVSRGLIGRRVAVDGRTSLYAVDDIDVLTRRGRRRPTEPRPTLDVQIVTAVTTLDESGVRYRGHDVATLARTTTFEQVAALLWTGKRPHRAEPWPAPDPTDVDRARRVAAAVGGEGLPALVAVASALGAHHRGDDAMTAARRLLGVAPVVLRSRPLAAVAAHRTVAARLAAAWQRHDEPALATALDRALVLLADHELATSTLAVRVAASTGPGPYPSYAAGLATVQGPWHGGAAEQIHRFYEQCERDGVGATIERTLRQSQGLPGFGHRIYPGEDPRFAPLLEVVRTLPDRRSRLAVVDDVIAQARSRSAHEPNVDLAVGALTFVADLAPDVPLFAVARIAGFAAHFLEEQAERPLRYRGLAR